MKIKLFFQFKKLNTKNNYMEQFFYNLRGKKRTEREKYNEQKSYEISKQS